MTGEILSVDFFVRTCLWQSIVLVAAGLAVSFLLRRRSSRAHRVLLLSMIAAVIVPTGSTLVKHYDLGMFVAESAGVQPYLETEAIVGELSPPVPIAPEVGYEPRSIEGDFAPVMTDSRNAPLPWGRIALCAWVVASLILVARLLVTFALGLRLLDRAEPLDCQEMTEAVRTAREKLGIDKDAAVRKSRHVPSPVIWCWRRSPVVLLPGAVGSCDDGVDWTGVLCHELAHWKRRDHISGLLAEAAVCVLPWNLLLWWAKSRLISLSEQACDDWVLATGQPGADYAEFLLDLRPGRQMAFTPGVVTSKKGLAGRIHRILKDSCGNPRTGATWALAVSAASMCLAVGIAFAQTRPADTEQARNENSLSTRFELGKDITIALDAGPEAMRKIVHTRSVRFDKADSDVTATLRADVRRGLLFEWTTRIELLGGGGEVLARRDSLNKARTLVSGQPVIEERLIEFEPFEEDEVARVRQFRISLEQAGPLCDEIGRPYDDTRMDWIQGRVTGPDGQPVGDAIVLISEHKPKGGPFQVPRVGTDENGRYKFGAVDWPYRLGVERRQRLSSTGVDCYQLILLNQIFNGPQTVSFKFDEPPKGAASLVGRVTDTGGVPTRQFKANVMEYNDPEKTDSESADGNRRKSAWYNQEVNSETGEFRLENVPAGKYRVWIIPKEKRYEQYRQEVVLTAGAVTNLTLAIPSKHVLYGRVLFEDGSPAVLKPAPWPGAETRILLPMGSRARGVATVEEGGYFAVYLDERELERLKSGPGQLVINVPTAQQGRSTTAGRFPFDLLATEKNKAGVVEITRPTKPEAAAATTAPDGVTVAGSDKDRVIQRTYKLKYFDPGQMSVILTPLLGDVGRQRSYEETNSLLIIDTVENLRRIEKIIAQFDVAQTEHLVTDIFEIYEADPSKVLGELRKALGAEAVSDASTSTLSGPSGQPVLLIPELAHKRIIVRALPEDMKQIAEWIEKLDKVDEIRKEYETVKLGYADVNEVVERLNKAIQQMPDKEMQQSVLIQPLPLAKQIMVFGREDLREMVKKLIAEIDVPPLHAGRFFRLKYADPNQIKKNIEALYGREAGRVQAMSHPNTQRVLVIASQEDLLKIADQIAEWDVPLDLQQIKPRIFTLRNADPVRVARLLTTLFAGEDGDGVNMYEVLFGKDAEGERRIVGPASRHLTFEAVPGTKKIIVISNFGEAYNVVGKLILELDKEEIVAEDIEQIDELIAKLVSEVTLTESNISGARVTGLVKDPQDRPVSGTRVTLFQTKLEYVTDAEGKFTASLSPSAKMRYFFAVDKLRELVGVGRLGDGKQQVEIDLVPATIVSGRVLDPNGRPVDGAQVAPLPMTCFHVLTDSEGRFDVGWSSEWAGNIKDFCLMARHVELNLAALVDVTPETQTVDVKLEPALALRGNVEDPNGLPIPGAVVGLTLIRGWGAGTPVRDVITDYQGRFELPALPQRQEYGLGANAQGYQRNSIRTGVINRVAQIEQVGPIILKKPDLSVSGIVVEGSGNPVAGIDVYWRGEGQPQLSSKTDALGRFRFDKVCSGPAVINAKNETLFGTIETHGGAKDVRLVVGPRFEPQPDHLTSVVLKLVGPNAQPVVGAWVGTYVDWSDVAESPPIWFLNDGGSHNASETESAARVISDEAGRVTLTDEELFRPQWPVEQTVLLTAIDEGHHLAGLRELSRKDLGTEVTVTLQPGCRVHGRVSTATARKHKWASLWRKWSRQLTVYVDWQKHRPCQYTSKEGRFEFVLPPGEYKVMIYGTDHKRAVTLPILIKPGQRDLDLTKHLE